MTKKESVYICSECGFESVRWLGQCPECKNWSTLAESEIDMQKFTGKSESVKVRNLQHVKDNELVRMKSGYSELDRVLGGGFVSDSVVLISGEPGIGKSTLLLQMLRNISNQVKSIYVSAEESIEQIAIRAKRVFNEKVPDLAIASAFSVENVIELIRKEKYEFVILDSVQTLYSLESKGLPGGFSQVKSVASKLVSFAKEHGVTMVIVGQINKEGAIAGPKLLEHLVDVVLQIEGSNEYGFRMLRSLKNRFGSANEVGLFEMTDKGMSEVTDPMIYFRDDSSEPKIGVAMAVINEGNRTILLEVQALTISTPFSLPKRVAEGINKSKLELLTAIIGKYSHSGISDKDVYVKIAGGIKINDPGIDLPVVLAILSSLKEKPIKEMPASFGEISLTGRIRYNISRKSDREKEIKRLGYQGFETLYPGINSISGVVKILK